MKSPLLILAGSILGALIYVTATYNFIPQDSSSYISYRDTLLIAAGISSVGAFLFWGFFEVFKVKSENIPLVIGISFGAQLLSWISTLVFPNFGILTFGVAVLVFSALGNFLLSKLSQ